MGVFLTTYIEAREQGCSMTIIGDFKIEYPKQDTMFTNIQRLLYVRSMCENMNSIANVACMISLGGHTYV